MDIIVMLVIGLIVGVVAKFLMPGKDPGGFIVTMLLGVAGSIVAGWLAPLVGLRLGGGFTRFIASVVGAMLLLLAYRIVFARRR